MMNRRAYLAAAAGALQLAVAGCSSSGDAETNDRTPEPAGYYPGIGDTFESVTGIEVTVDDLRLATGLRFEDGTEETTPGGEMFVLVHLVATNPSDEPASLPSASDFTLVTGDDRFDPLREPDDAFGQLTSPVQGGLYEGLADAEPQATREGWIRYRIPRDRSRVTISLSAGGIEAFWRTEIDPSTLQ